MHINERSRSPQYSRPEEFGVSLQRSKFLFGCIVFIGVLFIFRLFYLQVFRYQHYQDIATSRQLKEYKIPAERGIIYANDGNEKVALVLNERLYTLFADPKFTAKDSDKIAKDLSAIVGVDADQLKTKLETESRYVILAKKLTADQKTKIGKLSHKGIGIRQESYRTYPQGSLAAHVLGFVNNDGKGQYGVEGFLDTELAGTEGELKAITDVQGVPLVSDTNNVIKEPVAGDNLELTIDIGMQGRLEDILKTGLDNAQSKSGSVLVYDPNTGAIKGMANYPSYNPSEYQKIEDPGIFTNTAVSSPLEVGSIMKTLTSAAALDKGTVTANTSYFDPGYVIVGDRKITNVEEDGGAATQTVKSILQLSLNTGAVYLLKSLGGGQLNEQARNTWYDYMTNHYQLGKPTGVEQAEELSSFGYIPKPALADGINIQYANTAFGQGMTATPLQMAAALSSIVNGGTYYKPRVVETIKAADGSIKRSGPIVVRKDVVNSQTGNTLRSYMEYTVSKNNIPAIRSGYSVGGKTGTAEIAIKGGGYYSDRFNGTYIGYVGGDKPEYVISVRVNEPGIKGYAGAKAAAPIFASVSNMLIDNFGVNPKTQ